MAQPAHLLGVDIGGTNLRVALARANGEIVARSSATTTNMRDAEGVVREIRECAQQLLEDARLSLRQVAAIGAGAPGLTNAETGLVIATSYLMGWRDVPLKTMLEEELGVPASVDNDVNLAALGESCFGAGRGLSELVFLAIGTGVGAGIILKGELFQGSAWTAGEVGYMLVPGISEEPPALGKPGGLEEVVGGEGLRAQWRSIWSSEKTQFPPELAATQIFDAAVAGDVLANGLLNGAARSLGYVVCNIALILNTPVFVLGGTVGSHAALRDRTQAAVDMHARRLRPQLVLSALGRDAQLMGAIRLAQIATRQ
jgi:predicted NBD/HSP70 family sugar kinase